MQSNSILENNIIKYKNEIDFLLSNKFKDHSYGNSGGYGLNFLGARSLLEQSSNRHTNY